VRDLSPLARLFELRTVSLFSNVLSSLDSCADCLAGLPLLVELDLGGNPVAAVPEYKVGY
jgi:Leucine-rich repeat (LRR) protein